jgi:hypothetical protein
VNNVLDSKRNIIVPNVYVMVVGNTKEIKYDRNCLGIKLIHYMVNTTEI